MSNIDELARLIDDTAQVVIHPDYAVLNPKEIAQTILDAGYKKIVWPSAQQVENLIEEVLASACVEKDPLTCTCPTTSTLNRAGAVIRAHIQLLNP